MSYVYKIRIKDDKGKYLKYVDPLHPEDNFDFNEDYINLSLSIANPDNANNQIPADRLVGQFKYSICGVLQQGTDLNTIWARYISHFVSVPPQPTVDDSTYIQSPVFSIVFDDLPSYSIEIRTTYWKRIESKEGSPVHYIEHKCEVSYWFGSSRYPKATLFTASSSPEFIVNTGPEVINATQIMEQQNNVFILVSPISITPQDDYINVCREGSYLKIIKRFIPYDKLNYYVDAFDSTSSAGQVGSIITKGLYYQGEWAKFITEFLLANKPLEFDPNEIEGGSGDLNKGTDNITDNEANLPLLSAASTHLVHMYSLTVPETQAFGGFLWNKDISNNLYKMLGSPMDAILSLGIMPIAINKDIKSPILLGNLKAKNTDDTDITAHELTESECYQKIDFGRVQINEYSGDFTDYAPSTKISIYLPFIGVKELNTNDCMDAELHLFYNVDMLTGTCVAFIEIKKLNKFPYNSITYRWSGTMLTQIPISNQSYNSLISNISGALLSVAGTAVTVATSGATAGVAAAAIGGTAATSTVNTIANSAPSVSRGGAINQVLGAMDVRVPYIIIERPMVSRPETYLDENGAPLNMSFKLSGLKGYTEVDEIKIDTLTCTDQEKEEIQTILRNGVIL